MLLANGARGAAVLILFCFVSSFALKAGGTGQAFSTPQELVSALQQAVNTTNRAGFATLFETDSQWLANPDTVQAADNLAEFSAAFNLTNGLAKNPPNGLTLVVGTNAWPFPIPLVRPPRVGALIPMPVVKRFSTGGLDETKLRRWKLCAPMSKPSANMLAKTATMTAFWSMRNKSPVPRAKPTGYWPSDLNGELSPLGPFYAEAQEEGYFTKKSETAEPRPFHGYYFKILKAQGKKPQAGSTIASSMAMIAGFAQVAWPAGTGNRRHDLHCESTGPRLSNRPGADHL